MGRLQEAIEAALDVNAPLAAEVPDDSYRGFIRLGELGVLPRDLAERLASSAGLRNRLVHRCDILDDGRVLASSAMTGGPFRSAARACRG